MKKKTLMAALTVAILATVSIGVAATPVAAPVVAAAHDGEGVTRATLANGLRVVIVRNALAPTVITQVTYLAGGYETPAGFPGTAHAMEHMMFRGAKGMTSAQLFEMAGKMGAMYNAFTTNDATSYYFVAPSQYVDVLLHIGALRMRGADLSAASWSLEKGAIEQEVSRDISSPDFLALEQAEGILYGGTGYANSPLGTRPSFDATTSETLRGFYNDWYRPNNAVLVIAGDVDPAATLAKVKELFGPIPRGQLPARVPLTPKPFQVQTISRATPDAIGRVQYVFRSPGQRSRDFAAMQVLVDVLNNPRSALSELAAHGKVLSANARLRAFEHGGMGIIRAGFPKGGDAATAGRELDGVIANILEHGVPADLVEAAKRQEQAQFEFDKNSITGLGNAWSQALVWQGLDSPGEALQQVLAVTPADVDRVAREYLKPDQRLTVILTPDTNGMRPPDSHGFGGSEGFAGDAKMDVPLPAWASDRLAKLELPHWTLDPVSMKLPNGMTLIVQPETVSKTVTVVGQVDSDDNLQAPAGQEGVGKLLGSMFDYGTTTLDRAAFHEALDAIAATESAGTSFGLAVPSANFDRGVQLLADNELHPALPQAAFAAQQRTLAHTLAGQLASPRYKMMRALSTGLYPNGDPALREATPATVEHLTLADIKAHYSKVYRPDMTTIVVVGDVTAAQAKAVVEKYFGGWKATGPRPNVVPAPVPSNPAGYAAVSNPFASQDQVMMGTMMPGMTVHNPARYALQLGNDVLGGKGFASRLMTDIRVRHGYAYGAGSGMRVQRSRGLLFVEYASDPGKVQAVDKLVYKNLRAMRDTPVNQTELMNAKQAEIRAIPLSVSSVKSIARGLLSWSMNGQPLDEPMVAARHYLGITAPEVQSAFMRYVQPGNFMQVVQGPTPTAH